MFHQSLFTELSVRTALQAIHDLAHLSAHALTRAAFIRQRVQSNLVSANGSQDADGVALQAALTEAIEALKPARPQDLNDSDWRGYIALSEQYVRRRRPLDVWPKLALQESAYHDERRRAIIRLATLLIGWERAALAAQSAAHGAPDRQPISLVPIRARIKMIGRDALLADVVAQLCAGQDVAIHGPAGIGKSTFATAVANAPAIAAHFADGVLWAGLSEPPLNPSVTPKPKPDAGGDVFSALADWLLALGTPRGELTYWTTVQARAQATRAAIGQRHMLIVIDDAWTAHAALSLRVGGPNCAYLYSSRLAAVAGMLADHALPLPTLNAEDGLRVLVELAPAMAATHSAELTALAQGVQGLPLALMLMGRHLNMAGRSTPRRLENALAELRLPESRLKLKQDVSAPSLRNIIGLSERALDEPTRRAFHALSIFPPTPNTFGEEAALAVASCTTAELDALVDNGLIDVIEARYALHPVMRDYGQVCLTDAAPQRRMAEFFLHWINAHEREFTALEVELTNVLAALNSAKAFEDKEPFVQGTLAAFAGLEATGHYAEAETLLLNALAIVEQKPEHESLPTILLDLGRLDIKRADFTDAQAKFEHGLAIARTSADARLTAL